MPSLHKLTFGSALQIHIGTFEHRVSTSSTDGNPDLIPIYYFQHDVLGADAKNDLRELARRILPAAARESPLNSQQREGKVFKHQSDEAAS